MRVPVLIAAHNEADWLRHALNSLPAGDTEPIVIPDHCTDDTAKIAASFGNVAVVGCSERGKMRALQAGLRHLGKRAMEPLVTLDADTYPAVPSRWIKDYLRARTELPDNRPAVIAGSLRYRGGGTPRIRNLAFEVKQRRHRHHNFAGAFPGANMFIHALTQDALESLLELDNYWPGEDRAIKDEIIKHGGHTLKLCGRAALAITDGSRLPRVMLTRAGRERSRRQTVDTYLAEAPFGSIPYDPSLRIKIPEQVVPELAVQANN